MLTGLQDFQDVPLRGRRSVGMFRRYRPELALTTAGSARNRNETSGLRMPMFPTAARRDAVAPPVHLERGMLIRMRVGGA